MPRFFNSTKMVKGVIFDMDGVLVNNRDAHIEAFVILCRRYGVNMDREQMMPVFGRGNNEILPAVMPREIIDRVGMANLDIEKEEIYRQIYAESIEPVAGLDGFLHELKSAGCRIAVGSSGPKLNVDFVLEKCGFTELFDVAVNGDMVTRLKPDPDIFLTCALMLGVAPADCVVFEDTFTGLEAARRAGMKVVAVATTFTAERLRAAGNDFVINDFTEITASSL